MGFPLGQGNAEMKNDQSSPPEISPPAVQRAEYAALRREAVLCLLYPRKGTSSALGQERTNALAVSRPLGTISSGCYQHSKFDEHGVADPRNVNIGGLCSELQCPRQS
jgi:hypothetical protein